MNRPTGGNIIKIARKARGISQELVSEMYGRSIDTVSRWERGVTQPGHDDVVMIVEDVCGIDYQDAYQMAKEAA